MSGQRLLLLLCCFQLPLPVFALEPKDVFIVVNQNVPESAEVAAYYCKQREVPVANIVRLDLPVSENINRKDYDTKLRDGLRAALLKRKAEVKVLLTVYGVPLRVGASEPTARERELLKDLGEKIKAAQSEKTKLQVDLQTVQDDKKNDSPKEKSKTITALQEQIKQVENRIKLWQQSQRSLNHADTVASVDSELMLLWWEDYNLHRWQTNLLYFQIPEKAREEKPTVLMVSRLDGPNVDICKRLVDDALATEKAGLKGTVYVDARGIAFNKKTDIGGTGYGGYDESLREMAKLLQEEAKMNVVLDDKGPLFEPKSCKETALYCGWYSHANYVDCCEFARGSVAYHIASSEAVSLRNDKAKYWCPNMLKSGVAVTLGPVAEPYTIGFPKPAEFFGFLVTGKYTVVECYSKTVFLNSWMTVLVGDPLYNPYKNQPLLQPGQVRPSPAGGRLFPRTEEKKD